MTLFKNYSFFLLFYLIFLNIHFCNTLNHFSDFQVYPDSAAATYVVEDESLNNITYVCGRNDTNDCECKDDNINCVSWLRTTNVKPLKENFEIKRASFTDCNITTLKRDKILPDNEDTVTTLNIDSSGVKFIENGAFDKFISLKYLRLSDNQLTNIDERILTPQIGSTLIALYITRNNFTKINPKIFKNLKYLYSIFASGNTKLELVGVFPELNLQILDLRNCFMTSLPENVFQNLKNLEYLMLDDNNFASIPAAIKYLPSLKHFQLAHNFIDKIEKNKFSNNPKLRMIILHDNPLLFSIEDCAFCGLSFLRWVMLNSCHHLSYIHENAFGAVSTGIPISFELFMINECNITVLPENLIDWKNMKELNIGGNPFACNCSMAWIFNDLLSESSLFDKKIKRRYHGHKYILGCFPPFENAQKHFLKHLNISQLLEPCKLPKSSAISFWFIFMFVLGIVLVNVIYVYHRRVNFKNYLFFNRFLRF